MLATGGGTADRPGAQPRVLLEATPFFFERESKRKPQFVGFPEKDGPMLFGEDLLFVFQGNCPKESPACCVCVCV